MKGNRTFDDFEEAVPDRVFWVTVTALNKDTRDIVAFLKWDELPWEVRKKWDWYFKYRTALLQVKHPRYEVTMAWGSGLPKDPNQRSIIHKKKLSAKQRNITKNENMLIRNRDHMELCRNNWTELFPIEEDPKWQEAVCILNNLEAKIIRLKNEYVELIRKGP